MKSNVPLFGILTDWVDSLRPPFSEEKFFKILSMAGHRLGFKVIVFFPQFIQWKTRTLYGYRYHPQRKRWEAGWYPFPTLVYDRLFYINPEKIGQYVSVISRLRSDGQITWLNRGLPGKWKVYELLKENAYILPYLPDTTLYRSGLPLRAKLLEYKSLFLKPAMGTHGKGVLKVDLEKKKITVTGRNSHHTKPDHLFVKHFFSYSDFENWLTHHIGKKRYIVQPYLPLKTKENIPFDMRILVQKNGWGKWEVTGKAIRLGPKGGLTANLHGGGQAVDADLFLTSCYPIHILHKINHHLHQIITLVPHYIEKNYGPLCELGLDIGLEPGGKVWLLEVNSKPGRRSFSEIGNRQALKKALTQPIHYAHYLLSRGRSISYG